MDFARKCSICLIVCVIAVSIQVTFFSPLSSPGLLEFPPSSNTSNSLLQGVTKLGEGLLKKPEDISVDKINEVLYTGTRDGWIKRLNLKNGSTWENWKFIDGKTLLGHTFTAAGDLIVCDSDKGLLKINENGVSNIASHVNGANIRFADDVIEGSDGSLYFSVASTKFELHNWYLDVLEAKPHGQLLKYDPLFNHTTILLSNIHFANGVALSSDEDYLIICETWKFRCLKYWLKGVNKGKTDIFIDNLPGGPDNINLAPDGSFWIALVEIRFTLRSLNFIYNSKAARHFVATFRKVIERFLGMYRKATVIKVTSEGKIVKILDDPTGKVISFVTSAIEFKDNLYLGSLNTNFIGKLPLKTSQS